MKKYVIFIFSLSLLYLGIQITSGWILTVLYSPDISIMNTNQGEGAVFELSPAIQFLVVLFIATLAYFFSQKISATPSK